MLLRTSLVAVVLTTAVFAAVAAQPATDRYELKDGSMLYVQIGRASCRERV